MCAAATSPIAIAGVSEMAVGGLLAGHGGAVVWNNANNPLQIRAEGWGSSDPTLRYGSNQALLSNNPTKANADLLRKDMGVPKSTPGWEAHHIVPSTSQNESAKKSREILEQWGIDINQADNGILLPQPIHSGLANDHRYMDAVLENLENANSQEDAIRILQDIGQQLLEGTFPRARR